MTLSGYGFEELREAVRQFRENRNWAQFHTPKNLALALAGEVGEICQLLRWEAGDAGVPVEIDSELADVLIFLLYLADACDVDLIGATQEKMKRNADRFPPPEKC